MSTLATKDTVKEHGLNVWVDGGENGAEPKVDVILVQGLNAHPYHTWAGRQKSLEGRSTTNSSWPWNKIKFRKHRTPAVEESREKSQADIFWPKDLLSRHLGPARIATYSYQSDWRSSKFKTDVRECGEQLLNVLCQNRLNKAERRPLVLIGHSLGGVVIQQALVVADHSDEYRVLRESFAGAIFLGSPLQGCNAAWLAAWVQKAAGNKQPLLRALQTGSSELLAITRDFWSNYGKLPIVCFYERQDTKYGPLSVQTVTSQSATFLGKKRIYLNADHSKLNKYWGEEDDNFQLFLPELKAVVSSAVNHHSRSHLSKKKTGHWLLPFSKDKHFVDRPSITDRLWDILNPEGGAPVALFGIGGIGKSQIAIEYAYRLRTKSPLVHIFWVHAKSPEQFLQSYRNIAELLHLPGFDDPETDVLNSVYRWLSQESNGPWLMILDNMDDDRFVDARQDTGELHYKFTVRQCLPQSACGSVLITSRDRNAAFRLIDDASHLIEVQAMTIDEARAILDKKLQGDLGSQEECSALTSALECIPLALTQAVAYINRKPRMTIARYLAILNEDREGGISPLQIEESDLRRSEGVPNSVIRTWQITFDQIRAQHKSAADLLARMALFERNSVPEFLLREAIGRVSFDDSIDTLIGFALVSAEAGDNKFEMHRLVQLSTVVWLRSLGNLEEQKEAAINALAKCYPACRFENWTICRLLEPCAISLLNNSFSSGAARTSRAQIQRIRAWFFTMQGEYRIAEYFAEQSVDDSRCILGEEHPDTLSSKSSLARTYWNQGHFQSAEKLEVQIIETRKRVLGEEHHQTLDSIATLGMIYRDQGRWKDAEELQVKGLEIFGRILGEEHPDTLTSMSNLALIYSEQSRLKEAEELQIKELEICSRVLGKRHPNTLTSMGNLAITYHKQNQLEKAEELEVQVVETKKRVLGEDHPETLITMANLASTYYEQNQLEKAEEIEVQVMETHKRVLGQEHPSTLICMANLALTYEATGRKGEAVKLMETVVGLQKKVLGPDHPKTKAYALFLTSWTQPP